MSFSSETRALCHRPSGQMRELIDSHERNLLLGSNYGLCDNAPINFFGSIFLLGFGEGYAKAIFRKGFKPSTELLVPFDLATDLEISNSNLRTGTVLFKKACGPMEVGLVTTGPLSGLIVGESGRTDNNTNEVYPIRIFNDEPIAKDPGRYHPYAPHFLDDEEGNTRGSSKPDPIDINGQLSQAFKTSYIDYVKDLRSRQRKSELFVTDMLFDVCDKYNLPLDKGSFHYTREGIRQMFD